MARKTGSHSKITGPRIRTAALTLFARHGYAAVSMRQIAKEVGVQAGALYLYTQDKQSLLFDLMKSHMDELFEALEQLPPVDDPSSELDAFARFHIAFHIERPEAVFVAYMELRNLEPENFTKIEEMRRRYEARLEDIVKRGVEAGAFTVADSKLATMALIAMLTGVNTWYRADGRMSQQEVADIYAQMAMNAVGASV
ncbi:MULTISPECIES: TetR/AcrR family transcriptional regulator [Halocynthiibacter]|uniref:TetR/AcrR family transcriptional regulator n=1 Tax=Halocynthiibacter halioticoli TaxID=2986804 RepID=A0AAE3IZM8_9RHOB|nr:MULTISPECIES: TetR/AcrR family transcriptional regulator [Halocynthiibacter]MCV6824949.1 TetR/AcrR family transcriptional regulator [Halocynthiibacter halioticoli]MCW4057950.1 TetR/AcrR family transcriptional regulator [Halocynthiibacter sp. SDUM655004]